jgi:hypothetical protein
MDAPTPNHVLAVKPIELLGGGYKFDDAAYPDVLIEGDDGFYTTGLKVTLDVLSDSEFHRYELCARPRASLQS